MTIIHGDILRSGADIICHQVNCQGVMGAGLAKQIHGQHPEACQPYFEACERAQPNDLLGCAIWSHNYPQSHAGYPGPWFVHLCGQLNYGTGRRQTDYNALRNALESVQQRLEPRHSIAFPYGMGCGLAGGDWNIVQPMISEIFSGHTGKLQIWNYRFIK